MMKEWETYVAEQVHYFYHHAGINCAVGTLKCLGEIFDFPIEQQVYDSAIAMHGAGKYGAQCGILEGCIMFISMFALENNLTKQEIVPIIYHLAETFEKEMGSIVCKGLRPYPFTPEDAPKHLCEPITIKGIGLGVNYIQEHVIPKFS